MTEPTDEQVRRLRAQFEEEELRVLLRDTIEQLERLGDRLESYVNDKISLEPTELASRNDANKLNPPEKK